MHRQKMMMARQERRAARPGWMCFTMELEKELVQKIRALADHQGCSQRGVVAAALEIGLRGLTPSYLMGIQSKMKQAMNPHVGVKMRQGSMIVTRNPQNGRIISLKPKDITCLS